MCRIVNYLYRMENYEKGMLAYNSANINKPKKQMPPHHV
jgi:hypothetical protein